ncbi:MAG: cytochrome c [Gammaproteobacteria bacterium]
MRGLGLAAAGLLVTAGAAAVDDAQPLGWQDYIDHCAACHGADGRGDGPLAGELRSPPADLTRLAADNGGSFPETLVYQVIDGRRIVDAHGSSQMPIWGRRFRLEGETEMEIEITITALIDYLESLQRP